jgi:hypothetical protein
MDGPDVPRATPLPTTVAGKGYRVSLHVYEFETGADDRSSTLDAAHASEPAAATARRLALPAL